MKRSTLLLLLIAALGGVMVWYLEIKDGKPRDAEAETSKPAFTLKREDITGLTITRGGQAVSLTFADGKWAITQPIAATANTSTIDSLVGDLVNARVERTFPAAAEELKNYGLSEPAVTVEIKLKEGKSHRLRLGAKDFSNVSVYGLLDDAKDVSLFPGSLLTSADKSLNDLRDLTLLGGLTQYDIASLSVVNTNGSFGLSKQNSEWVLKAPAESPADESEVNSLLGDLTSARATEVASESAGDLAPYGLVQPTITLAAQLQAGGERRIIIGTKTEGENKTYFAKSSDRSQVFKIDQPLYDKLNLKVGQLRSKQFIKINQDELTRVQIRNPHLSVTAEKNADGKWMIKEPADQKDKEASSSKIIDPFDTNRATEVLDKPSPAVSAKLSRPAVEARLTTRDGRTTTIKISAADGDDVYLRVEGRPEVYKVSKSMLDALSFKAADLVG